MVKKIFSHIIYFALTFLFVSLKAQNNRNDKEPHLFTEYFGTKKYSYPSAIDFNTRNRAYLGINSKDTDSKGYSEIVINNEYIDYQINQNYKFIKIGQDDLPDLDHVKTEIKQNKKLPYFEDVLDLNKVLYQDDKNAIANIINWKKDLAADIVILFDYEKDDNLNKAAVKKITSIKDQPHYFNWSILFYNDKSKDQTIRKELLLTIFNNNANLISDLVRFIVNNKTPFNQAKTDEALVYLLHLQLKKNENNDWKQNEGFGMLSYCYDKDRDLMKRLKSTNFYNDPLIKNATEAYNTFNQQETSESYTIQDPDGYTNLRKDKNTASEVLQKIKSGEQVNVLDQNGDWWLIETKDGKQGYVHKSRIKSE
ncbi:SH3 domain-containing protein [Chryseobacterium sp. c4a]|uniref:SH3 domain-containing protein n=1 Tax=Chryseobacterium sp. c4a TaxID=1573582 RepID=UPI00135C0CD3|nr:SH3 domain-containing protein [Chryseobacterium sp. c4a]